MQNPNPGPGKDRVKLSVAKPPARKAAEIVSHTKAPRTEASPFKQTLDALAKSAPAELVAIITSLPRGSLQIAQPAKFPESLQRAYAKQFHLEDKLTWQAISAGKPVCAGDVLGKDHVFFREYLQQAGLVYAVAAPLRSPIIEGYAGAIHLYRSEAQGPFTAEELRRLGDAARQIDKAVEKNRDARFNGEPDPKVTLTPRPAARLFAFDANGREILSTEEFSRLDERLQEEMTAKAKWSLARLNGHSIEANRVQLADSRGDLWTFRVVNYASYPAMTKEPVSFFCMQPSSAEWAAVRPADLQADGEIARLIPALKFMQDQFHRGPTLGEIAKQVHLSPFHFHRRFAELLGLTPKHYLLECQINAAKVELLAGTKELSQIAADCGFAHQSHFTSRFKQATGLTPTRWRPAMPRECIEQSRRSRSADAHSKVLTTAVARPRLFY